MDSAIVQFETITKEIFGIYLDSIMGFEQTVKFVEQNMKVISAQTGETEDEISSMPFRHMAYFSEQIHEETYKDFIRRMSKGGKNYVFAANMYISSIYSYWEDYYRAAIASELNIGKNDLKSDIFGDLKRIRRSIIPHRAVALKDVEKCKMLRWFKENDKIELTKEKIIIIKKFIENFIAKQKSEIFKNTQISDFQHFEIALAFADFKEDRDLAKIHFEEAISISPQNSSIQHAYAKLLVEQFDDFITAEKIYKDAILENSDSSLLRANYGALLTMTNRVDEAVMQLQLALKIDSANTVANYNFGIVLNRNYAKPNEAKIFFKKALDSEPKNLEILIQYADVLKQNQKTYKEAELAFRKILDIDPNFYNGLNDFGLFLMQINGDYKAAEKYFSKAIASDPERAEAYYNYGNLLFLYLHTEADYLLRAKVLYKKSINLKQNYFDALINLATLCVYGIDEIQEGIMYLEKIIKIDPNQAVAHNNLASIYKDKTYQFDKAEHFYQMAISIAPHYPLAHFNFSQLLFYNLSNRIDSIKHYKIAIKLDSTLQNSDMEYALGL